jgi:hypothetical protein
MHVPSHHLHLKVRQKGEEELHLQQVQVAVTQNHYYWKEGVG